MPNDGMRRLLRRLFSGNSAESDVKPAHATPTAQSKPTAQPGAGASATSGRARAIAARRRSIEEQRTAIARADAERGAIAREGSREKLEAADYERIQMRRYLEELEADLVELESPPPQMELGGAKYDDPLEWTRRPKGIEAAGTGLAIVVGHEKRAPGAAGRFEPDVFEYNWNTDLARQIEAICKANNIRVGTFFRDNHGITGAYNQVDKFNPAAAIELHFNAADGKARGTETLYARENAKGWAEALQQEILAVYAGPSRDEVKNKGDRKLKYLGDGGRGAQSLTELEHVPTTLIEPFFGDVVAECRLATPAKPMLARAIVTAFARHAKLPALAPAEPPAIAVSPAAVAATPAAVAALTTPPAPRPVPPVAAPAAVAPVPPIAAPSAVAATAPVPRPSTAPSQLGLTAEFEQLREVYARYPLEFPHLRAITYAQWAHESDFGRSELARKHRNFAGMKWVPAMSKFAREVVYNPAHDPDGRTYCGFDDLEKFIAGFWHRLDLPSLPYATKNGGWRKHAASADQFIDFIGPIWAPRGGSNSAFNEGYEAKVRKRYAQLAAEGRLPSNEPAGAGKPVA